jgi:hypothetical protein
MKKLNMQNLNNSIGQASVHMAAHPLAAVFETKGGVRRVRKPVAYFRIGVVT